MATKKKLEEELRYFKGLFSDLCHLYGNQRGDHIYSVDCPSCGRRVWVNNGDTNDVTVPDVEAVQCPWCDKVFPIPGSDEELFDPNYADQGYKSPNEACGFKEQ